MMLSKGIYYCMHVLLLAGMTLGITFGMTTSAHAEPNCEDQSRITHQFDNGAVWDLCWESRIRENLVLSDIHYTPPEGDAFRVLSSARLSQLHVAYDDSDVTYNDITQFGLGGNFLLTLTDSDCPNGVLLDIQQRPALCQTTRIADNGYRTASRAASADSLNLFSVSQVGAYAYIVSWSFYDDGTFEPGVGATGALQRSSNSTELPFGRILEGDPDTLWLSHTHNYYWRLDFDLGDSALDDIVAEYRYTVDEAGRRELSTETFTTEQARRIDPDAHQLWRIMDDSSEGATGYQIEPVRNGHRYQRKEIEPYTDFDFFVTVGNDCERFASQNARFNPDCLNDVLEFVDGQSIENEDIIVWNRVSFHHTPRNEDQRHMHTHWDEFAIRPVNLLKGTGTLSDLANTEPTFATLESRQSELGVLVHEDLVLASDADGDVLSYSATGLPLGLAMRPEGHVHGYTLAEGSFDVQVTARDDQSEVQSSFVWTVGDSSVDNPAAENTTAENSTTESTGRKSGMGFGLVLLCSGFMAFRYFAATRTRTIHE